ncbi:AMP-binding protein [Frigoribacterium sp. 2-23]|uniref:AMP-binding protein n=1 Tax=Frigoribacterium sp. 2-23 TaxID=3415006 RepID=UPI003C6EEC2B
MSRPLRVVDARHPEEVLVALRDALAGGPAVTPRVDGTIPADLPPTVSAPVALVVETSGSTGRPKRVELTSDALLAGAAAADGALGGPGHWLLALPAHYIAGLNVLVRSIVAGTEPVLLPTGHFDPAVFAEAASRLDPPTRYMSLVPAQLGTLLDAAARASGESVLTALRSFDAVLVGGQATPLALVERARAAGVRIVRTYGSSETSGGCVYDGRPIGQTQAEVVDGEIQLAGPSLASGYLGDGARTDATFVMRDGHRWYRTGDTGALDADGTLRVTGRLDDVIVSGGEKVSLAVVERAVREQPGLSDAVVVRAAHDRWGEVPVVVTDTVPPALQALRAAVVAETGRAGAPDRIVRVDAVPLLASGKPDRAALTRLVAGSRV